MKLDRRPENIHSAQYNQGAQAQNGNTNYEQSAAPQNPYPIDQDIPDAEINVPDESGIFRKLVSSFIMACAFTGLAILGWFAYEENKKEPDIAQLPVIKADDAPYKIEPTEPSGAQIPNTDKKVFDTIASNNGNPSKKDEVDFLNDSNITFLPPAEEPIERNPQQTAENNSPSASPSPAPTQDNAANAANLAPANGSNTDVSENAVVPLTPDNTIASASPNAANPGNNSATAQNNSATASPSATGNAQFPTPPAVNNGAANPQNAADNNTASNNTDPTGSSDPDEIKKWNVVKLEEPEPSAEKLAATEPAAGNSKTPATAKIDKSAEKTTAKAEPAKSQKKVELASISPKTTKAAKTGKTMIQLGSYKSVESLERGWLVLKKKYPELGSLRKAIETVNLEGKGTFYRLHAGPFSNKTEAKKVCDELATHSQGCIVAK